MFKVQLSFQENEETKWMQRMLEWIENFEY